MAKKWFTMKHHGWGWVPITWEGWAVILGLIGWIVYITDKFEKGIYTQETLIIRIAIGVIAIIIIGYMKGPNPKWRWDRN